ncbi:cell division protein FtsL [Albirhodobacter sp. R86504]|uniref:cell division protein FtsL n=1 Tax=Albirhodobacter sp. R86504 TaxID=3093848 RepID=UPI00366DCDB1
MRNFVYLLTAFAVMGLAFWAYRENYRTQDELSKMSRLQSEIAGLRDGLSVMKAEWAYLNRPDRLRELANLNFESLSLLPMAPEQFGAVNQIAFPVPDAEAALEGEMPILDPIDLAADTGSVEEAAQ